MTSWKKVYALIKYLKYFRIYVLHSHIITYVPSNVVKTILTRENSIKFKSTKFYVLNEYLYWKAFSGVLLNFLLENEAQ